MAYYQSDMLSIRSRTLLANILAEVVLLSEAVEQYREALARIPFFDCIALFRFLDREEKGYLREKDFQRVVGSRHRKLLTYAFSWFDNMKVGEISRLEFAVFLLPKDDLQLRQLVAERVENPEISYAQHETLLQQFEIFRQLLLQIMNREMRIIQLRRELVNSEDYSSRGALVAIDGHDHRWVCCEDVSKFLKNYGFQVGLRQVEKLIEAINCSLDGKISEQQLAWVVEGFETKNKAYLAKIKASNKKEEHIPDKHEDQEEKQESPRQAQPPSTLALQFQQLSEKMRLAEKAERQADQELIQCDLISVEENRKLCDQKLAEVARQREARAVMAAEREQALMEQYHRHQLQQQMRKEAQLLREKDRLVNLEKRLHLTYGDARTKSVSSPTKYNKRLYSFAEESPARASEADSRQFQIIDAHLPRRDYQNLTNLNSLSIVESYRRASEASDVHYQLGESTAHFNTDLHQRIKHEIEQEKAIQDRLSKIDYTQSKFVRSPPAPTPPSDRKSSQIIKIEPNTFESPERVPNFKKSAANKFTVSTGNKLSGEKL